VTPCSLVVGYQRLGGSCCLHLQVVTVCSVELGYQRFGRQCCLRCGRIPTFRRTMLSPSSDCSLAKYDSILVGFGSEMWIANPVVIRGIQVFTYSICGSIIITHSIKLLISLQYISLVRKNMNVMWLTDQNNAFNSNYPMWIEYLEPPLNPGSPPCKAKLKHKRKLVSKWAELQSSYSVSKFFTHITYHDEFYLH